METVIHMAENSAIEWTDHTFNPWVGCTKVSPACDNCYAESWAKRAGTPELWSGERRRTRPANWAQPLKWNAAAGKAGMRARVFCASLADVFDNAVPQQWRDDLFHLIRSTPHLDWLLLSKRIGNAAAMLPPDWGTGYSNVWLGSTVVTQAEADRDIPKLRATSAAIRFLSCEPLLERMAPNLCGIHWVIVGGESGSHAREMRGTWAEQIATQCRTEGVAFFFKQGSTNNWARYKDFESFPPYLQIREWPTVSAREPQ